MNIAAAPPPLPHRLLAVLLLLSVIAACQSGPRHPLRTAAVVDSVVAPDVAIARFRAGLFEPTVLAGGAPTRDSLFNLALRAISERDTALMRRLTLTKAEFAWLYYPTNPQALPPYDLDPQLMWFLTLGNSDNGLREALNAYGGRSLSYRGGRCEGDSSVQGSECALGTVLARLR